MEKSQLKRNKSRKNRVFRVRKKLKGTTLKPRLSVHKSAKHLFAQIIDDERQVTILGVGTQSKSLQDTKFTRKSKESARHLGALVAKVAKEKNIEKVVFDRGRFKYHGIIAEFASSAREAGLQF